MNRYEYRADPVWTIRTDSPPGYFTPLEAIHHAGDTPLPGWVCKKCGSVVAVARIHDEWHET